jgi:putative tributyrin esterase
MQFKPEVFFSSALNSRKTCYVLLPPSYDQSSEEFPVIYLLHGMHGGETDWIYKGNVVSKIQELYSQQQLRESIFVLPSDGGYDKGTFYVDWYDGSGNYEQYFIYDLVQFIDSQFRTIKTPKHRAIGGLSMGGYGAFMLSLRNPNLFGAAASLSGAIGHLSSFLEADRARLVGPVTGPHALKYDLAQLAAQRVTDLDRPDLYVNCGTEDFLYEGNVWFKNHLDSLDYPATYKEYPGEHNWIYWETHIADALLFFESSFKN